MGIHKKFSGELYRQYDSPGIDAVLAHLDSLGVYAKRGADKYGVDAVVYSGFRPLAYIEVEVSTNWTTGPFPYPDCHVLERKGRWMLTGIGLPVTLYRLCKDLSRAILIPDHTLAPEQLTEIPNRLVGSGEHMYCVPVSGLEEVIL